jgi:hypothetical protein
MQWFKLWYVHENTYHILVIPLLQDVKGLIEAIEDELIREKVYNV